MFQWWWIGFVQKKVLKKLNITGGVKFNFNGKKAGPKATVSELGIINGTVVDIISISGDKKSLKEIKKEEELSSSKINIKFNTTQGTTRNISFDENITIGLAIQKYLERVGKEDLINSIPLRLAFLYNAQQFKPSDTIKLKDLFRGKTTPKIIVNDVHNLIAAWKIKLFNNKKVTNYNLIYLIIN